MKLKFLVLAFLLLAFGCSNHGNSTEDYLARNVTVNGKVFEYRVYLPPKRDPGKKLPVMLYLHGSGSRGDDNTSQIDGFRWAIEPLKENFEIIAVLPQCRPESFWAAADMTRYSMAALNAAVEEFNGDRQRIYVSGFSLGGYGALHIAAANPGKFAALIPVAGGVVGERPVEARHRAVADPEVGRILDSPEPYAELAKAVGHVGVWAFHGSADKSVPVEFSRKTIEALKRGGNTNVRYTEYEGEGHMISGKAFSEPGLFEWLTQQKLSKSGAPADR